MTHKGKNAKYKSALNLTPFLYHSLLIPICLSHTGVHLLISRHDSTHTLTNESLKTHDLFFSVEK